MPKISVCVPVYNVEQYIGRCLDSILSQSLTDIEIIVVNDCTTDSSMDVVLRYANTDNRIKIIDHEMNHGLMVARKTGYMIATGDFITFLDSDDTLAVGALETLYSIAIKENADIVSGTIQHITNKGKRYNLPNKIRYGSDKMSVYKSLLLNEIGHNLCSRLFRRELLQNHIYKTFEGATNGEDGILFYQVVENARKIVSIKNVVYEYYQNMMSSSQVKYSERALWSILVLNSIRVQTAGKYLELRKIVSQKVSGVLFRLKIRGYNIDKYIFEQKLEHYCKISTLIGDHGVFGLLSLYIKLFNNKYFK